MQDAADVARCLDEIAILLAAAGEVKFKVKAYERGARVVDVLGGELALAIEEDRLRTFQGIGAVLAQQIIELWNTGSSELLASLRRDYPAGATELLRVRGMTPRRIRALHAALGVRSMQELLEACRAERVRSVPGFGEATEQRLLAASERLLRPSEASSPEMRLAPALELASRLQRELSRSGREVHVAGALRRGVEMVREIELVVAGDGQSTRVDLSRLRQVVRVDAARGIALLSDGMPLRVHSAQQGLGNALFFATGSREHVSGVCEQAARHGFALGEESHGDAAALPVRTFETERALYAALDLAEVPPELREGRDELERARNEGFADLVGVDDIRGMVHCHTTYSDGKASIEEMSLAAHALGMKYITITDHSPSAHYAQGLSLDQLKRQWDEIAAVQERVPIRILRGTESDILSDGSLDFPDAVLEQFDVIIASIHARHRLGPAQMTERLVHAMSRPLFKVWGHALGRILGQRAPIECDVLAVLDALAQSRGAVELNADPHRLDLPARWIPAARARGIPFVISVDAHSTGGFGVLHHGITQARRGGIRAREVLNTRSPDEFSALVRPV